MEPSARSWSKPKTFFRLGPRPPPAITWQLTQPRLVKSFSPASTIGSLRLELVVGLLGIAFVFSNTVRDNGSGEIWEYANLIFPARGLYLPGMSIDLAVAEKMTDPGKVTIRFEGTKHYDDYELKGWEKASIKAGLVMVKPVPTRDDAAAAIAVRTPEATP